MEWIKIKTSGEAQALRNSSLSEPGSFHVIFKNSTRCGSSRMAKTMFESDWNSTVPVYLVNVIEHREASDSIAKTYGIKHESPQVLVILNGKCIYHNSHSGIDAIKVMKKISEPLR